MDNNKGDVKNLGLEYNLMCSTLEETLSKEQKESFYKIESLMDTLDKSQLNLLNNIIQLKLNKF